MTLLTGLLYPLLVTGLALWIFPKQAGGSLVKVDGGVRGSELIGQAFHQAHYFWPRPSAHDYDPLQSGGTNLGPTSRSLKEQVEARAKALASTSSEPPPSELVYASGSGLDPHMSLEAAEFQFERIARSRHLSKEDRERLREWIQDSLEGKQMGLFGPRYLNVLKLNQLLDQHFPLEKSP